MREVALDKLGPNGEPHDSCRARQQAMAEQAVAESLHLPSLAGLAAPFAVVAALYACAILAPRAPWPAALCLLVLGGFCHVLLAFIGHDAGHGCYSRSAGGNATMGLWMFAHSYVNFFGFRSMHRGHHFYTGFDDDPSGDSPRHARRVGVLTYSLLVLLPLGFPILVILPSWLGALGFQPHVYAPRERLKMLAAIPVVVFYHLALYRGLALCGGPTAYAWFAATFVVGLWLTTMVLSLSHASVEMYTDCKLCNTRTITSGPVLGVLTAHGGYHVEHHVAPHVPWYRMPRVHEIVLEHGGSTYVTEGFAALHVEMYVTYWKRALARTASLASPASES